MPRATPAAPKDAPEAPETPAPAAKPGRGSPAAKVAPTKAPTRAAGLASLSTLEDSVEYINALWWGPEGTGKSTDIMTAANHGKVIAINAEGGIKKKPLRDFGIDLTNIIPWPDQKNPTPITFQSLEELSWDLASALENDPGCYFAVAWDSGSEIYDILVANERINQFEKNALKEGTANYKEYREDPTFTDIADYGVATTQYKILLRRFRDLPCHFLITSLSRRDVDEDTSKVAYGPAVGPSAQTAMLGLVDLVVYTQTGVLFTGEDKKVNVKDEFYGLNRPDGLNRAKDRFRAVPRNLAVPTFERYFQYVTEALIEEDDDVQKDWIKSRAESADWEAKIKEGRRAAMKRPARKTAEG